MPSIREKLMSIYNSSSRKDHSGGTFNSALGGDSDPSSLLESMKANTGSETKWQLTNIGDIGSEQDKNVREKAAATEEAFEGAGSQPGLEVWRIEKFEPEKIQSRAGNLSLYSGDCYIILKTTKLEDSEAFDWQLHYWIGKDCTQDESGSAAYFTVNVDDLLDQKPTQHREVQFSESSMFRSYFTSLTYLEGGIDSGFKSVEPETYKPRLLQMATVGNSVSVLEVPMETSSLNDGDVFILDNGLTIYQFNAPNADFKERNRAREIVQEDIKAERDGMPELTILDGDEIFECEAFWEILGDKLSELPAADGNREVDTNDEVDFTASKKLFKISDESGKLMLTEEKEGDISDSDVNDSDIWVIICDNQCFIYIGEGASIDEKYYVRSKCGSILVAAGLDASCPVTFFAKGSDRATWNKLFS